MQLHLLQILNNFIDSSSFLNFWAVELFQICGKSFCKILPNLTRTYPQAITSPDGTILATAKGNGHIALPKRFDWFLYQLIIVFFFLTGRISNSFPFFVAFFSNWVIFSSRLFKSIFSKSLQKPLAVSSSTPTDFQLDIKKNGTPIKTANYTLAIGDNQVNISLQ